MIFSRFCTHTVLCLIIVTLVIPSGLLFYPKKAEAVGNDCLVRIGATLGLNKVISYFTGNKVPINESSGVQAGIGGSFVQDCVIEPLVTQMAKAMLYNITVSTVEWINSGFQGNPGFVQDLRGLMIDTADQVIGEFLEKEAAFLCTPFAFQVRIQLAQTYLPLRQRAACTLSDAIRNVEGFAESNNGVGWENWLEVTTVPQNNQYGAFVIYQDELSKKIVDAQALKEKYLNWGNGFKDWETCETQEEADAKWLEENRYSDYGQTSFDALANARGKGIPECTKETPGKIVQDRLSKTLSMDLEQLAVADNLNAIMDALANQLTKQLVNGATGLLGGRRAPNTANAATYGSIDYSAALQNNNNDPDLNAAIDNSFNQAGMELTPFFSEPIEVTAPDGDDTDDTEDPDVPAPDPKIELSTTRTTSLMNAGTPFVHQVDLVSNYSERNLSVKMTLKRNDVAVPLTNIFVTPYQITFGSSSGSYPTRSMDHEEIEWKGVYVDKKSTFMFKLTGNKNSTAAIGEYTLETVLKNSAGDTIDTERSTFTVQ